jgi:hypothetical protein
MDMTLREAKKQVFLEMASHFETWDEATQDKALGLLSKNFLMSDFEREGLIQSLAESDDGNLASEEEVKNFFARVTK